MWDSRLKGGVPIAVQTPCPHMFTDFPPRHFRNVSKPLVNHNLWVATSRHLAPSQSVNNHVKEYTNYSSDEVWSNMRSDSADEPQGETNA